MKYYVAFYDLEGNPDITEFSNREQWIQAIDVINITIEIKLIHAWISLSEDDNGGVL